MSISSLDETDKMILRESCADHGGEASVSAQDKDNGNNVSQGLEHQHRHSLNTNDGNLIKANIKDEAVNEDTPEFTTCATKPSPKKRGSSDDSSAQPAKKRSPQKNGKGKDAVIKSEDAGGYSFMEPQTPTKNPTLTKKPASNGFVKNEITEAEEADIMDAAAALLAAATLPVTPIKGKRSPAKSRAVRTQADSNVAGTSTAAEEADTAASTKDNKSPDKTSNSEITDPTPTTPAKPKTSPAKTYSSEKTTHNTPRKRQAPKYPMMPQLSIPASWEEATEADRKLMQLKREGKGWTEIRTAWKKITGQNTAPSTLPNRYNRIKSNLTNFKEGDTTHLLTAKAEVETSFAAEKWGRIATAMQRRGTEKYPTAFLIEKFGELEARGLVVGGGGGGGGVGDGKEEGGDGEEEGGMGFVVGDAAGN